MPCSLKKRTACCGATAPSTAGYCTTERMPSNAIVTNHTTITGPNSRPTLWVPYFWIENTHTRIATATGTTYGSNSGVATFTPSIAPSTVIAGVIMPSP